MVTYDLVGLLLALPSFPQMKLFELVPFDDRRLQMILLS